MRSRLPYIFFALAAILAIAAVVLLIVRPGVRPVPPPTTKPSAPAPSEVEKASAAPDNASQPIPVPDPETALAELGIENRQLAAAHEVVAVVERSHSVVVDLQVPEVAVGNALDLYEQRLEAVEFPASWGAFVPLTDLGG